MDRPSIAAEAQQLADFIRSLSDFALAERGEPYRHMGATITDAVLQAGMRYETQVWPRVKRLLEDHPEAATASAFLRLLEAQTPEVVVGINGRKAKWVKQLTTFFVEKQLETEEQLRSWLAEPNHEQDLLRIKGVGLKTANYLKLLVGITESVAIDTHLRAFLRSAGIPPLDDRTAGDVVAQAAALLAMSPARLDASIWEHQARGNR